MRNTRQSSKPSPDQVTAKITLPEFHFNDDFQGVLTRIANIAMGTCWSNNLNVNLSKEYTGYVMHVMMIYLNIPQNEQWATSNYIIDSVLPIYFYSHGEPRKRPTIYAEPPYRGLTK